MTDSRDAPPVQGPGATPENLQLAAEGSADAFWCLDLDDQARNWLSDQGWALLRRAPQVQGPTLESALAWVLPEDRGQVKDALQAQYETGRPIDVTFRMQLGDGTVAWLRARAQLSRGGTRRNVLAGSVRDVSAEHAAMLQLGATARESRLLLREISHRVKNNLQLIISMLMIQARAFDDERVREAFAALANRIKAIGAVNNHLRPDTGSSTIVVDSYLRDLVGQWRTGLAVPGDTVSDSIELPNLIAGNDDATCLGLILNELVTNAFKHARPAEGGLCVLISARKEGADFRFEVEDDGISLPADFQNRALETAGTTLVSLLCDQLGAELVHHRLPIGTRVELRVPAARLRPGSC